MSDPVSNADIEDVLSSIRRLVSDEPTANADPRPQEPSANVERFVLTPAFRVEEEQAADNAEVDLAHLDDAGEGEGHVQNVHPFVPPVEELAEQGDADPVSHDDEMPNEAEQGGLNGDELNSQIADEYQSDGEWKDENLEANSEPHAEILDGDEQSEGLVVLEDAFVSEEPKTADDLTLEERIAGLEAAIELAPQEWEPDGSETDVTDETTPIGLVLEDSDEAALAEALDVTTPKPHEADSEVTENVADTSTDSDDSADEINKESTAESFVSDLAAAEIDFNLNDKAEDVGDQTEPEADIFASDDAETSAKVVDEIDPTIFEDATEAETPETVRDVDASIDDTAKTDGIWDDAPMRDVTPDDSVEVSEAVAAAALGAASATDDEDGENFLSDDADLLDEESLRAMVADLVREELQGVLGERITRNVRRLVRREIQRALTMRDLD